MSKKKQKLRFGLPKGSLQDATVEKLAKAGWNVRVSSRSYLPYVDDTDLEIRTIRAQEMSVYVERGYLDCVVHGLVAFSSIESANFGGKSKESLNVHIRIGWCVFGEIADHGFCHLGLSYNTVTAYGRVTAIRRDIAGDHSHCGRFAGAIGAKEAQDFAFFDLETKVIHGHVGAEGFSEILNFNHVC